MQLAVYSWFVALEKRLTILGLQITVKNGHSTGENLGCTLRASQTQRGGASLRRVDTIVTAEQSHGQLAEDTPDECLLSMLVLVAEVADDPAEVTVSTILHIKMQVLALLKMLSVVVGNDIGMAEVR